MIKLYTIGCPACERLEKKLTGNRIFFQKINNINIFETLGINIFPAMQIDDGQIMSYGESLDWIDKYVNERKYNTESAE